jgi:hypothetical protein
MSDQYDLRLVHGYRRRHGGVSEPASECAAQGSAERVGAVPALERLHLCAERRSQKGWFGADALRAMPNFEREFVCDPREPHWGFRSWDDYFTRRLREGVRPVADPGNDRVLVNACESAPYRIARDVQYRDRFWIKSQPYSIAYMLANDPSPRCLRARRYTKPT